MSETQERRDVSDRAQASVRRALDAGLYVTQFNSGSRYNESNGFRVFKGRTPRDHFDAGWLTHCDTLDGLNAYVAGYIEGRAA